MKPAKMEDEFYEENRPSLAQQAARASLFAPFIAIGMNILTIPMTIKSPSQRMTIGLVVLCIIIAGLICAIIGLCGVKRRLSISKRRGADLLIISILGLMLNGALVYFTVATVMHLHKRSSVMLSVSPPEGFEEYPEGRNREENVFCAYRKGNANHSKNDVILIVIDLGGTVTKEDKLKNVLGTNSGATFFKENWKGHQIEVARLEGDIDGTSIVGFNALVPTTPRALLVKFAGPQEKEDEIKGYLSKTLKYISGSSNWQ